MIGLTYVFSRVLIWLAYRLVFHSFSITAT